MKTQRRHELETNTLADWLGRVIAQVTPYRNYLGTAIVALLVVVLIGGYSLRRASAKRAEAWTELLTAASPEDFAGVANRYSDSLAGSWAKLRAADGELRAGLQQLFSDRDNALVRLRAAQRLYDELTQQPLGMDFLDQRAAMGAAKSLEALGELEEAGAEYQGLLDRFPGSPFAKEAKARLDDLKDPEVVAFYEWLESREPAEEPSPAEGTASEGSESDEQEPAEQPEATPEEPSDSAAEEKPADAPSQATPEEPDTASPVLPEFEDEPGEF